MEITRDFVFMTELLKNLKFTWVSPWYILLNIVINQNTKSIKQSVNYTVKWL